MEDDQTEQPAPVFYYDLKEGNRIDFNILIRAHNVVHNVDEADASYVVSRVLVSCRFACSCDLH